MPDVEITRKQVIVVAEVGENSYGDLTFTDKDGNEYKVGTKRRQYFNDIILPGVAVQLNYSTFKGREYIYNANQVEDMLPSKPQQALQSKTSPAKEVSSSNLSKDAQIERAVWIKELGEGLRSGYISKDSPEALFYRKELNRVLEIKSKEVQPAKSLIEEAKKLGAKEIRKEDNN